jgi:hypothetical protein
VFDEVIKSIKTETQMIPVPTIPQKHSANPPNANISKMVLPTNVTVNTESAFPVFSA